MKSATLNTTSTAKNSDCRADFSFDDIHNAYEAFEEPSKHGTLKVTITMPEIVMNGFS
jgi:hypothetical protein